MEILERTIHKGKMIEGEFSVIETKQIKDIIDEEDVWTAGNKFIISHLGIQKLADYVGAEFSEVNVIDKPNEFNERGFYVKVQCLFPDGTIGKGTGESHDKNTTIGKDYKLAMAEKRAQDRAFLRNAYTKLYDILSEEEADSFRKPEIQKIIEKTKKRENRLRQIINDMSKRINLPEDSKYPNLTILEIWKQHQDIDYIEELSKNEEDKVISFIASQLMKNISNQTNFSSNSSIIENSENNSNSSS